MSVKMLEAKYFLFLIPSTYVYSLSAGILEYILKPMGASNSTTEFNHSDGLELKLFRRLLHR